MPYSYCKLDLIILMYEFCSPKSYKTQAELWDLVERGPRLYVFPISLTEAIENLRQTALLFIPALTPGI